MKYIPKDDVSLIPLSGGTSLSVSSSQRGYKGSDECDVHSGRRRDDSLSDGDANDSLEGGEGELCGNQRLHRYGDRNVFRELFVREFA